MSRVAGAGVIAAMAVGASVNAQAPDLERIRAKFVELVSRPKVALAAESRPRMDSGFYRAEQFSFASEAGERVPSRP